MKTIKKITIILFAIALLGVVLFSIQFTVSADSASVSGISYMPSTAEQAKYVPNFVKTNNSAKIQTLYNPYTAKLALDLSGSAYSIGNDRWDDILLKEGYTSLQYIENMQLHLGDRSVANGTVENIFTSVNVIMGIKKVTYNGIDKYAVAIAFRGTGDLADIVNDGKINILDPNGFHVGFKAVARDFHDKADLINFEVDNKCVSLTYIINQMKTENSEYCMLVTGHSLGGAVADMYSGYYLYNAGVHPSNMITYTFAAARSAPSSYNYPYNNIINFINADDWVPTVGNDKQIGQNIVYSPDEAFRESVYGNKYVAGHSSAWWSSAVNFLTTGFVAHGWKESYANILLRINENTPSYFSYSTSANNTWSQTITIDQNCFSNISGNVKVDNKNTLNNNGKLIIKNDLRISNCGVLNNNGELNVLGDVNSYDRHWISFVTGQEFEYRPKIYNYGTVRIHGNLKCQDRDNSNDYYGYYYQSSLSAKTYVAGNISFPDTTYSKFLNGQLILNGTLPQYVSYLKIKNISVENPSGIVYNTNLYLTGEYLLNGNPLNCNGKYTVFYSGASFDSVSDYKELNIVENTTLTSSVKGNINISHIYSTSSDTDLSLTIPNGYDITVDGKITLSGKYASPGLYRRNNYSTLKNYGKLTVTHEIDEKNERGRIINSGDLLINGDFIATSESSGIVMSNSNAIIKIAGNFIPNCRTTISKGTIVFIGNSQQLVQNLDAYNITVDNKSGIAYKSSITLRGLYKLNNNPLINTNGTTVYYTYLHENAAFADGSDYKDLYVDVSYNLNSNVKGNIYVGYTYSEANITDVRLTIPSDSKITVDGDITLRGNIAAPALYAKNNFSTLCVNGDLTVTGNIVETNEVERVIVNGVLQICNNYSSNSKSLGITMNDASSIIKIGGNFLPDTVVNLSSGTIIFNGSSIQRLNNLNANNIVVENNSGIQYTSNITLHGTYILNNNPLYNTNGSKTYYTVLTGNASFADDSDYKDLYVNSNFYLNSNVKANILVNYIYSRTTESDVRLIVSNGKTIKIDGNIELKGALSSPGLYRASNYATLQNYGTLIVTGNVKELSEKERIINNGTLEINGNFITTSASLGLSMSNNAILRISGNFTPSISFATSGKVIFNGTYQQTVKNMNAATIELLNESEQGVVFSTAINPSVLFNHNGNHFTVTSNSTFVDYDGDGLKDNVDPEPTVGLPCVITVQSNDVAYGSVSVDTIETFGGTKHTVTATPTFKYRFVGWKNSSNQTVSTAASYTFVAKTNDTLTAIFQKRSRPIIKQSEGGTIIAPSSAEIESAVSVTVIENEGYIFTDGSLKINGEVLDSDSFVMPDEPVNITAEFVRNDNYFALKEAIISAQETEKRGYTKESCDKLLYTIDEAQEKLVNHISKDESDAIISSLLSATDSLCEVVPFTMGKPIVKVGDTIRLEYFINRSLLDSVGYSLSSATFYDSNWHQYNNIFIYNDYIEDENCLIFYLDKIDYSQIKSKTFASITATYNGLTYSTTKHASILEMGMELFDANGDGAIDIRDLVYMKKTAAGAHQPEETQGDLDGNGEIDALDLTYFTKILLYS